MTRRLFHGVLIGVALLSFAASIHAGGWAIVTFERLPDYFVAGQPSTLILTVRQHGMTLMNDANIRVTATSAGAKTEVMARPTGKPGEYRAEVTVSTPGAWMVSVNPNLFTIEGLLPIYAIRAGETPPRPLSQVERGERLFVSKGCLGCHANSEIAVRGLTDVGPELTGRRFPVDYLRGVLANPAAGLVKRTGTTWEMPNLNLQDEEIAALTAYINRPRNTAVSKAQ
jgi:hypothetical protein